MDTQEHETRRVWIRESSGLQLDQFSIEVKLSTSVREIKQIITERTGIELERQKLILSGGELKPDSTFLQDLDLPIQQDCTLRLIVSRTPVNSPSETRQLSNNYSNQTLITHVKELRPNKGHISGGTLVKIIGEHFIQYSSLACKFGGLVVPCNWKNEEVLECVSPPHSPGDVAVEVCYDGRNYTNDGVIFSYIVPSEADTRIAVYEPQPVLDQCKVQLPISVRRDDDYYQ